METVKHYLLSVICCAVVCALVCAMAEKKGATGAVLKLVSGIFLAFTVVSPIRTLEIPELSVFTSELQEEAAYAAALGESYSRESMSAIIKAETEAYILDKATAMGAAISAEVVLDENLKPKAAFLFGEISAYAKFRLQAVLADELGITKENQQWND